MVQIPWKSLNNAKKGKIVGILPLALPSKAIGRWKNFASDHCTLSMIGTEFDTRKLGYTE